MMRYVRGWEQVFLGGEWEPAKAKLRLNMVELQRDILKTRREDIKRDDQLFRERSEELEDVRRQISMIDRHWTRVRWTEDIVKRMSPLVTGLEWIDLQKILDRNDWFKWEELNPEDQWGEMIKANLVFSKAGRLCRRWE